MSEVVLGFDVGIKNLGYCLLDKKDNDFNIQDWNIINLTENGHVCSGIMKSKIKGVIKLCTTKAKFYCETDDEIKYYCGVHKSQHVVDINELEKKHITECNCDDKCCYVVRGGKVCDKKAVCLFDGETMCAAHKKMKFSAVVKSMTLRPIKKIKCTEIDPQILCHIMCKKLNDIELMKTATIVRIENQPAYINATMKVIASFIFSYFVMLNINYGLNISIKYVSADDKIIVDKELIEYVKKYVNDIVEMKQDVKARLTKLVAEIDSNYQTFGDLYKKYKFSYETTKELGILYTLKILSDSGKQDLFKMIKDNNKKDDLCDAFLHAYKNKK